MNLRYCIIYFFLLSSFCGYAQRGFKKNETIPNFQVPLILNHPSKSTSISQLSANITIIDFFGTWCAPCIKALPHLNQLKEKYKNQLSIILLSIEEEIQLQNFLKKNPTVQFPIIVDKEEIIAQQFMPPSYPYSVILDKSGKILSLTNAADIKEDSLTYWLSQNANEEKLFTTKVDTLMKATNSKQLKTASKTVLLSQELLYAARTNNNTADLLTKLASLSSDSIKAQLDSDDKKKAFWINIYNAFILTQLKKDSSAYKNRNKFFSTRNIIIGNTAMSFDDIEHGLLRKSQVKWGLGYISKVFPRKIEKQWRVDSIDYRIHFALNCGASSCPPIAFYDDLKINEQLQTATNAYLSGETKYDTTNNTVIVPKLLSWFRGDFGTKKEIRQLLEKLSLIPANSKPSIKYAPYNWNLNLNKFIN